MKKELELGALMSGKKFTLPVDFVTRTLAIIAIRGAGKTVAATVLAEEMCEAGLPWVALDPTPGGVWWGLRCEPDGSPGGYPVVIIGGEHADLPFEKNMGPQMAEAILQENVPCIIDVSLESKNVWRHFLTEFCERLLQLRPAVPRHIFIEEAPEFVPQKPLGEQKRSLAAVDRLSRLGRNVGYGATLISQRFATVNKDVLTQCENLLALRSIGKKDRKAAEEWIAEVVQATESEKKAEQFINSLTQLEDGIGWFWSPQWLKEFVQVRIRRRKTLHPGETRTLGQLPKQVQLSDSTVREFIERFSQVLAKAKEKPALRGRRGASQVTSLAAPFEPVAPLQLREFARRGHAAERAAIEAGALLPPPPAELIAAREEAARLRAQVADFHRQLGAAKSALDAVRKVMEPEYRAMQKLFAELDAAAPAGTLDASVFDPWKQKLGVGPSKVIDVLLSRGGECTRAQLQTLAGYSPRNLRNIISRLNVNGLIEKDGETIRLRMP